MENMSGKSTFAVGLDAVEVIGLIPPSLEPVGRADSPLAVVKLIGNRHVTSAK